MTASADLKFLEKMADEAKDLEDRLSSKDHWAKPYYSDLHVFKPGVPRVFIGLNPGGDGGSKKYYEADDSERKMRSGDMPYFNAYLDENWGNSKRALRGRGQAPLQIAAQRVFQAMYGDDWENILRNTPCFNLAPICSKGSPHTKLRRIWKDCVLWGVELIRYLKPQSIILFTNGKTNTPWAALRSEFGSTDCPELPVDSGLNKSLKQAVLVRHPLMDIPVLGLPHLTSGMNEQVRHKLYDILSEMADKRRLNRFYPHPSLPSSRGKACPK